MQRAPSAFSAPAGFVTRSLELAEGQGVGLPPGTGKTLVQVEQGAGELEVGKTAAREHLMTTIGSDTSYAIRTVPSALMLALLTWSVSSGDPKPSPCRPQDLPCGTSTRRPRLSFATRS